MNNTESLWRDNIKEQELKTGKHRKKSTNNTEYEFEIPIKAYPCINDKSQDGFLLKKVDKNAKVNENSAEDNESSFLQAYHTMMASSADLTTILENNLQKQSKLMQAIMGFFS